VDPPQLPARPPSWHLPPASRRLSPTPSPPPCRRPAPASSRPPSARRGCAARPLPPAGASFGAPARVSVPSLPPAVAATARAPWPRRTLGQRHGGPTSSAVAFAGAAPRSPPRRPPDEVGRCAGPSRLRSARLCGGRSRSRWRHGQGGRRGRRRCLDTGTGTAPQPRRRATTRPMDSSASADARPDAAAPRIALFAAAATDSVRPGLATTGDVRVGVGGAATGAELRPRRGAPARPRHSSASEDSGPDAVAPATALRAALATDGVRRGTVTKGGARGGGPVRWACSGGGRFLRKTGLRYVAITL